VGVLGATAWLALGHSLFGPDVDLLALLLGSTLSLIGARFFAALSSARPGSSFSRACRAAVHTLVSSLPAAVAVAGAILASGRFVVGEIVAEQGGAPWRWAGFRSPGLFVLLLVLVATALPQAAGAAADSKGDVNGGGRGAGPRGGIFLALSEAVHLWVTAALAVLLFLGGSRLPGVTSMAQEVSPWLAALGLAGSALQVGLLALSVAALRRGAGGFRPEHVAPLAVRHAIPVSVGALVMTALFAGVLDGADTPLAADISGTAFSFLSALVVVAMAFVLGRRSSPQVAGVNPWL
jgi:NADH:ubiquinone oxidoreductase subunit H